MSFATSAVQPVWWLAPMPAPVSPWKYSWNRMRSLPVLILLEFVDVAVHGTPAVVVAGEDAAHAARQLGRNLPQCQILARTRGALHLEVVAQVVVEALQRLDQQEVHREPDRPAPVGVAAEESGAGFARLVVHPVLGAADVQHVGIASRDAARAPGCRRATGTRSRRACT